LPQDGIVGIGLGDRDVGLEGIRAGLQRDFRIVDRVGIVSKDVEGARVRPIEVGAASSFRVGQVDGECCSGRHERQRGHQHA
jgi:hypothetical protein